MDNRQKIAFSAIQASGALTLGNYLGALQNWVKLQHDHRCIFMVADLHALTVRRSPDEVRKNTLSMCAALIAIGIDPEKNLLFVQSHVPTHTEMNWILACYTQFGELSRMTQFKDKSKQHADNINVGLFTYPCLMAGDILLYDADFVPVGKDQTQHIEITRDIATRFNALYGNTFRVPEAMILENRAKIMSLQDPEKKMSKSDPNANSYIALLDRPDEIMQKVRRCVTDSDSHVKMAPEKPGIANLMRIYSCLSEKNFAQIEEEFQGRGYGDFKQAVGESIIDTFRPIQSRYGELMRDPERLLEIYKKNAQTAFEISCKKTAEIKEKIGITS